MSVYTSLRPIVAFALLALPAAGAAAQQSPSDPVETAPVHFWRIGLRPSIVIRDIGRDNNVKNESSNPKSDFTMTLTPKTDVYFKPGRLLVTYTTGADYVYFHTYEEERGVNAGQNLRLDLDLGPFKPYGSIGGSTTRERLNREVDERARRRNRNLAAGLRIQLAEPLYVSANVRSSESEFDEEATFRGESLAESLNSTVDGLDVALGVAVTPLTTTSVVVSQERARFPLAPDRNSESLRIMPTVTFSPLAILSGSLALGYRKFTPDGPTMEPYSGFAAALTLSTTLFERHSIESIFSRDLTYSYEEATPYYIETGVQLTWRSTIVGPLDGRLTGSRSRLDYRGVPGQPPPGSDVALTYGFGMGYRVTERLKVELNGDWKGRDSSRDNDRTYDNRRIYATVTWGVQ